MNIRIFRNYQKFYGHIIIFPKIQKFFRTWHNFSVQKFSRDIVANFPGDTKIFFMDVSLYLLPLPLIFRKFSNIFDITITFYSEPLNKYFRSTRNNLPINPKAICGIYSRHLSSLADICRICDDWGRYTQSCFPGETWGDACQNLPLAKIKHGGTPFPLAGIKY
jgi:hypothetical protein